MLSQYAHRQHVRLSQTATRTNAGACGAHVAQHTRAHKLVTCTSALRHNRGHAHALRTTRNAPEHPNGSPRHGSEATDTHLVHPVRVQHSQVAASLANTLLRNGLQLALELQLRNTLRLGLAVHNTLGVGSLAAATSNGNAEDDEACQIRDFSNTVRGSVIVVASADRPKTRSTWKAVLCAYSTAESRTSTRRPPPLHGPSTLLAVGANAHTAAHDRPEPPEPAPCSHLHW